MKRSLLIAIAVLLIAALFVGCNADKIEEDQLVEVTISADEARGLSATGTSNIDVDDLDWYYTAIKTSGYFRTGEHAELTLIDTASGISGASIGDDYGKMSTGGWVFCFYGYVKDTVPAADPKANAIFYQENLRKTITSNISLEISLSRGAGEITPVAKFEDSGLFWLYNVNNYIGTITLVISNNDVEVATYIGTVVEGAGKVEFKNLADIELELGANELQFDVFSTYIDNGVTVRENLGRTILDIAANSGMTYTITSDETSIDFYPVDVQYDVEIGDLYVPVIETESITFDSTAGTSTVVTSNTPSGEAGKETTVIFSEDMSGKTLTVETSSAEIADAKFTISGATAVASINLTLSEGNIGANQTATITTYIDKNLDPAAVHVYYAGDTTLIDYKVSYAASTGELVFETSHFSEFFVTVAGEAQIGTKVYKTFADAIAAAQNGATITLLQNVATATQIEIAGKTIVLNLNGKTISYTGTDTLPSGVILVHNGASLTINDSSTGGAVVGGNAYAAIAVTKAGDDSSVPATLVVNNGTFTGYYYAVVGNGSRHNTDITINNGVLEGTNGSAIYHPQNGVLTINGGTFTGYETAVEIRAGNLTITDGTFTATSNTAVCAANGSGTTTQGVAIAVAQHTTKLPINVTINGGSFNAKRTLLCSNPQNNSAEDIAKVNVTINGGQFSSSDCALNVYDGLSLTINDVIVSAQEACVLLTNAGKVIINGGTFTSIDNFVVGTNGSAGRGGNEITINGGTFNGNITSAGYSACGVYLANADTLEVSGGTFNITKGCGILARSGSATIGSDVEINVTGGDFVGKVGDSRVVVPCKELVIDYAAAYPGGVPSMTNNSSYEPAIVSGN